MKKPESRIGINVLAGEGPNGEDVVQTIDKRTGDVIKEELRRPREPKNSAPEIDPDTGEPTETDTPPRPTRLLTAQEMLYLAVKEREETFGRRVNELAGAIQEKIKSVILAGKTDYSITDYPGEVVKGAIKELRGLGYKLKQIPQPETSGTLIVISWPTKLKARPAPASVPAPPVPKAKRGKKPAAGPKPGRREIPGNEVMLNFGKKTDATGAPTARPKRPVYRPRQNDEDDD